LAKAALVEGPVPPVPVGEAVPSVAVPLVMVDPPLALLASAANPMPEGLYRQTE